MQSMRDLVQKFVMCEEIPAMVGRERVRRIGHQRGLRGFHFAYEIEEIRRRITLDVELGPILGAQHRIQFAHVLVRDVAGIGARMNGDAVASGVEARTRGLQYDWADRRRANCATARFC